MKKLIVTLLLCIIIATGCKKKINVIEKEFGETYNFKISFDNGFFYNDKDTQKILIKFYDDEFLFIKDTWMGIDIYISGKQKHFQKLDFKNLKIFFIKAGGGSSFYGFMESENLKIKYNTDFKKALMISGKLISKKIFRPKDKSHKITFEFRDLKLSKVDSMKEILDQNSEFFRETLKEYMPDW